MTYKIFIILLLSSLTAFCQTPTDTVTGPQIDFSKFDFDTANINDVFVYDIELKNNDTIKKSLTVIMELDSDGRIIKQIHQPESSKRIFSFYNYSSYPTIYKTFLPKSNSNKFDLQIYTVNKAGLLSSFTDLWSLRTSNQYFFNYKSEYKYSNANKLIEKTINSPQQKNNHWKYEYDTNGRLKKYTYSQDYMSVKDSIFDIIEYATKDSSYCRYIKQDVSYNTTTIYENTLLYDKNGKLSIEREKKTAIEKNKEPYLMMNTSTYYEYDQFERAITIKTIHHPDSKEKPIYIYLKLYKYNTNKRTNLKELDVENGS